MGSWHLSFLVLLPSWGTFEHLDWSRGRGPKKGLQILRQLNDYSSRTRTITISDIQTTNKRHMIFIYVYILKLVVTFNFEKNIWVFLIWAYMIPELFAHLTGRSRLINMAGTRVGYHVFLTLHTKRCQSELWSRCWPSIQYPSSQVCDMWAAPRWDAQPNGHIWWSLFWTNCQETARVFNVNKKKISSFSSPSTKMKKQNKKKKQRRKKGYSPEV